MADYVKDKIEEAGNAVGSAAKTAAENTKAVAGKPAAFNRSTIAEA